MQRLILIASFVLLIIVMLLGYFLHQLDQKNRSQSSQIRALTDTLTTYKTKDGKNAAYISVLEGTRDELLEVTKKKDKEVYDLLKKVKNLEQVIKFSATTAIDTVVLVDTVIVKDSSGAVIKPSQLYALKTISNPHYWARIELKNDSLDHSLKVYNDFLLHTRYESNGWFKPKTLIVDIANNNPYTETTGLSSYKITPPKRNNTWKIIIGTAVGFAGGVLLAK